MVSPMVNTVVGVVLIAMILIVGVIVFGQFEAQVNHSAGEITESASAAINKTTSQTYAGFNLGSLIPYIMFAVAIIVVLLSAFAFGKSE